MSESRLFGTLARWEKDWGYLSLKGKKWRAMFPATGVRFTLVLGHAKLYNRYVDKYGRIFVGKMPLDDFEVGDALVCYKDSDSEHHIFVVRYADAGTRI